MRLSTGDVHRLAHDFVHDARGRVVMQTLGNDAVTQAVYDTASDRLTHIVTTSPEGKVLQDLTYRHDPVGNVVSVDDATLPARHWRNARSDGTQTFVYDTLYQLVEATGREAGPSSPAPGLPDWQSVDDDTLTTPYTRRYTYDASGNLLELVHSAGASRVGWTQRMAVSERSNRSVIWGHGDPAPDVDAAFDACGNLRELVSGQPMTWNAGNRLDTVTHVTRDDGNDDNERYAYDAAGQRVRKVTRQQASGTAHEFETRYLPGVELRRNTATNEILSVPSVEAGRVSIHALIWSTGRPSAVPNGQVRYLLSDLAGSIGLELDEDAQRISVEGYFPFGGTAWRAARSTIEADYRTVRYSGRTRDATGLYDYGQRYYAPWLHRWIHPDPAGNVDGLNRFRFAMNSPMTMSDSTGMQAVRLVYGYTDDRTPYMAIKDAQEQATGNATVRLAIADLNNALGITDRQAYNAIHDGINVTRAHIDNLVSYVPALHVETATTLLTSWAGYIKEHSHRLSLERKTEDYDHEERFDFLRNLVRKNTSSGGHSLANVIANSEGGIPIHATLSKRRMKKINERLYEVLFKYATDLERGEISTGTDLIGGLLGNALNNRFFRQTSKLGLSWAYSDDSPIENAEFLTYGTDRRTGQIYDLSYYQTAEKGDLHDERNRMEIGTAGTRYFPITHSELRHVRRQGYPIIRIERPLQR
ncbi:RHS repeat-associated core domain-containing protein [Pandoraea sputorum]|uniref:RHS repeat-associated core domain-containing protein n=1 Tax=Pandoraea sputorum TaxID=93222 RepID=UPI001782D3BD|nr:RHS repeat-associated core domain-containing protein [Pandoraea sputorum]